MDKFVVTGIPAFNGEYPIDVRSFTMRELQIIKRMSGVRAGELEEAFNAGDSTVILSILVIAVRRSGRDWETFEKIAWDCDMDAFEFVPEPDEDEGDAVPLTLPNAPDDSASNDAQPEDSGERSNDDGDAPPVTNLRATGSQG